MTLTVSQVGSWKPDTLRSTHSGLAEVVERIDGQRAHVLDEQDVLAESWHGDAASAAATRIVRECSLISAVTEQIHNLSEAYETAAGLVEAAKSHVEFEVSAATTSLFDVSDQGIVSAEALIAKIPDTTQNKNYEAQAMREAAARLTQRIVDALSQAEQAVVDAMNRLDGSVRELIALALKNPPGHFVETVDGGFTWQPDVPATVASSVIGGMSTGVVEGLKTAAVGSVDDVARNVSRGFGVFGSVLGTVPAIKNDIDGGMDPTQAIVTESSGALVGVLAAGAAGGLAGSVFPGIGTVGGAVVGLVAGGVSAYLTTRGLQKVW